MVTTPTKTDFHQLRPFSKCGKNLLRQEANYFFLRAVPLGLKKNFLYYVIWLECVKFSVHTCVNAHLGATAMIEETVLLSTNNICFGGEIR